MYAKYWENVMLIPLITLLPFMVKLSEYTLLAIAKKSCIRMSWGISDFRAPIMLECRWKGSGIDLCFRKIKLSVSVYKTEAPVAKTLWMVLNRSCRA